MFKEVELERGQEILLSQVKGRIKKAEFLDKLMSKVLAEEIFAPMDVPPFRRSPLDGFAYRSLDGKGASPANPVEIKIIDEIQAGDTRLRTELPPQRGVKVLTGAPLPPNADIVIRKEDIDCSNHSIMVTEELEADTNIIFPGSDIKKGERVFAPGEILEPYHIGVLAALGFTKVKVYQSPRVALISIGNELKEPGEDLCYGQIYNSNIYALRALVNNLGGTATSLGIVSDDEQVIKERIRKALAEYDLVITTGGASVGDYDLIEQSLENIGAGILFNRVAVKPGSPVVAALKDSKLLIGLSGNPAAALITFELLVRPVLRKFQGIEEVGNQYMETVLVDGFTKKSPQRRFLRVKVSFVNGQWIARQTGNQQSSILRSMVGCNALVDIPRGSGPIKPGEKVRVLLLKQELPYCSQ
ncbi:MAG: gephyrin-like molybdotransferase Glp [Peptococcaceae bacterium]